jgi:hypothetical protein
MLDTASSGSSSCPPTATDLDIHIKTEVKEEEEEELRSRAAMFTSLDHCYVSTACPPAHIKHEDSSNFIDTPPESSEDSDDDISSFTSARLLFPSLSQHHRHNNSNRTLHHHHRHNINNNNTLVGGASLLKKTKSGSGGVAKFSFRVKLKTDTSSRSVLKQHLRTNRSPLKVSAVGFRTAGGAGSSIKLASGNSSCSLAQAGVRRRKEASLKLKHEEAREVHNQMERQRRNELKIAFDELKASITDIADSDKVSKQMILDKAVENCRGLRSREAALRLRRERLKRCNSQLKERLRLLQQQ